MDDESYGEPLLDDVERPSGADEDEDEDHFLARLVGRGKLEEVTGEPALEPEWDGE